MNIFQIIPNRVFIENEEDEIFVDNLIKQGIVDKDGNKITKANIKYALKPLKTIISDALSDNKLNEE